MGLFRWMAAKLGRRPDPMEHAKPEPDEVIPETPLVEGSRAAATPKAA